VNKIISRIARSCRRAKKYKLLPRGFSKFVDIKRCLPQYYVNNIFDVGANVGQSAKEYTHYFPDAQIYCFEPVKPTFDQLVTNLKGYDNIHFFSIAFGASKGVGKIALSGPSDMFHIMAGPENTAESTSATQEVQIESLDAFCKENGIDDISYLKIDTEGYDLEVLKGAGNLLTKHKIGLVELEAGMNPGNKTHIPFERSKEFLEMHRYFLFGVYEQIGEWPTKEPHLRRTNPIYISENVILANTLKKK
jgi:FkbM family methyltransferase